MERQKEPRLSDMESSLESIHHLDIPPGEAPGPATNLTLTQEAGGWVLRWLGPPDESKLIYYTVQIKEDSDGQKWMPLTASKIDVEEASYMSK